MRHLQSFAPISRFFSWIIVALTIGLLTIAAVAIPSTHLTDVSIHNGYFLIPGLSLLINVCLIGFLISRKIETEAVLWLIIYLMLFAIVSITEVLTFISNSPDAALFWATAFAPAGVLGPATVLFAFTYTNRSGRRYNGLVAFIIVAAVVYVFFNTYFLQAANTADTIRHMTRFPWGWVVDPNYNPGGSPFQSLAPFVWYIGTSWVAIARLLSFRRHTDNHILKRQSGLFIAAIAVPVLGAVALGSILLAAHSTWPSLSSPLAVVSAALLVYGIYKYDILTISPAQFSETILSLMDEAVIVTDTEQRMLYRNPAAIRLLEATTLATVTSLAPLLSIPSATKLRTAQESASATGNFTLDRIDLLSLQHTQNIPLRVASSRLRFGHLDAWVLVLTDITDELNKRRTIEHEVTMRTHELNQARASLLASISSLHQGFLLVNAEGIIELSNEPASALFASASHTVIGQALSPLTPALRWSHDLGTVVAQVLHSRHAARFDSDAADGHFYRIDITPVILNDTPLGATVLIENTTEQKILERSRDEFFSIASHELRTPLTAIRGNMSMAQEYFPDALKDPVLRSLVDDSHAASVRLIAIVNDFLDSSKLEQGKMTFTLESVTLQPLVQSVINDLTPLTRDQGNTIYIDESVGALPSALADIGRLRQILYNLLSNANKYTEHGDITVSGSTTTKTVTLTVTDTGKGMSPESQQLLFHKFQQAGDNILTRDDTKGTGLGLYISRLLATNMHGTVDLVHSTPGKGSAFMVRLQRSDSLKVAAHKKISS